MNHAAAEYDTLLKQAQDDAPEMLSSMQIDIRSHAEKNLTERLKLRYGSMFQKYLLKGAIHDVEERIEQRMQKQVPVPERPPKSVTQRLKENEEAVCIKQSESISTTKPVKPLKDMSR